jgi:predicted RNase H-like nuclease (RuvC/YqgF family)
MPQEKVHVGARIPKDLAVKCEQRYGNMTNAINIALELLFNQSENIVDKNDNIVDEIENNNRELKAQIEEKEKIIKELQAQNKEPNKEILQQYEARITELKAHNESLEKDKERAGQEKEAIQNLYNNYMLQMQTLIQQKSIEAPGSKRPWWRFW